MFLFSFYFEGLNKNAYLGFYSFLLDRNLQKKGQKTAYRHFVGCLYVEH